MSYISPLNVAIRRVDLPTVQTVVESRGGPVTVTFEHPHDVPDWVLVMRACFGWGQLQMDALRYIGWRGIWLKSTPETHTAYCQQLVEHAILTGGR